MAGSTGCRPTRISPTMSGSMSIFMGIPAWGWELRTRRAGPGWSPTCSRSRRGGAAVEPGGVLKDITFVRAEDAVISHCAALRQIVHCAALRRIVHYPGLGLLVGSTVLGLTLVGKDDDVYYR